MKKIKAKHFKFFIILYFILMVVWFFVWIQRMRCFEKLADIDHAINCERTYQSCDLKKGDKWDIQDIGITDKQTVCPLGYKYDISYIIGERPSCPFHGNLMQEADFKHHPTSYNTKEVTKRIIIFSLDVLSVIVLILLLIVYKRKYKIIT